MATEQRVITVTSNPPGAQDGEGHVKPQKRPKWMVDGSFLVFRKLEQDVQGWNDLTSKYKLAGCDSAEQFGAKLMGRWANGE